MVDRQTDLNIYSSNSSEIFDKNHLTLCRWIVDEFLVLSTCPNHRIHRVGIGRASFVERIVVDLKGGLEKRKPDLARGSATLA